MGPVSFLNGAFLAALAAAALPILIHLFSRRRLRQVPFSHLAFLDEITRRKVRRMRLRQWLLLALRTLAVALIALALSRPVWHGPGAGTRRGSSTIAILIDDSFSMEARSDPGGLLPVDARASGLREATRFVEARARAREALALLEEGDRAILVFMAAPVQVPYESTVRDAALLLEELGRARPRPGRADLAGALERVYPLLAAAHTLNREIVIVSDFQQNQAEDILSRLGERAQGPASADTSALLPIPPGTRLYLLPVSAEATANVALVGALYEKDPAGRGGRLTAHLRNFGDEDAVGVTVQALGGGETGTLLGEGLADVPAGATGQAVITLSGDPEGGLLAVRASPDLLERDDVRFVVSGATSRLRVLLVTGGSAGREDAREEALFPLLALDPWHGGALLDGPPGSRAASAGEPAQASGAGPESRLFEVEIVSEADFGLRGAIDADAVVLLNVGRLSASAVESLARFQTSGGGILISLGDRVDPRLYDTQILPRLASLRLEDIETRPEDAFTLRPSAVGHPLFAGFPIAPGGALSGARFHSVVRARPGERTRVLAEFSGGLPALLEEPGLLVFTSSLDLRWSDFPTSASYLPFLHRALLQLALRGQGAGHEPLVGSPLGWPLTAEAGDGPFRCAGPAGLEIPVRLTQTDQGPWLYSDPVPEPGFYRLLSGQAPRAAGVPADSAADLAAVNVDVRESDLRAMTAEQAVLLFGQEAVRLEREGTIARRILETRYGRELWRLCLVLAFGLLVTESLIARGRGVA